MLPHLPATCVPASHRFKAELEDETCGARSGRRGASVGVELWLDLFFQCVDFTGGGDVMGRLLFLQVLCESKTSA